MIKPFVAGQFYEANFDNLNKQIEECFYSDFGPGDLPVKRRSEKKVFGIVSPHAGYQFSGACQAWAYKEIAEAKFPKTFVILGPDHNGLHSTTTTTLDDWETPFGVIESDKSFLIDLMDKCDFIKKGMIMEHSIEVQLPFLQFVNKDNLKKLKIAPLVVPTSENYAKLGEAIAELGGENICIIASSDFTHYGPQFFYTPFKHDTKKNMYNLDNGAIGFIKKLDAKGFLNYVRKTDATICGTNAIAVAIEAVKNMFAKKGKLLRYYTSGDIIGDYGSAVGYAAISFK